jgi:hypothetical protein
VSGSLSVATMRSCPRCLSSNLTRDGHDQRGRPIHACGACWRHARSESVSLVAGHRFPRDVILLAVRSRSWALRWQTLCVRIGRRW